MLDNHSMVGFENHRYFKWYFTLFDFISQPRVEKVDVNLREIHAHTSMVLSTGILMWSYAILAHASIQSPLPAIVGYACSLIHILSPFLYRWTNSTFWISNIALSAGFLHQFTFSFFTGGYDSFTLKWFSILPMLAGVICGMRSALIWGFITLFGTSIFLILKLLDFDFPNEISETGRVWGNALILYGYIFLTTVMILIFVSIQSYSEKLLQEQGQKIDDLFRVLFHDLANSLGRINIGLSIARKGNHHAEKGVEIATQAADSMMEITSNVRRMYAVSKGKAEVDLTYTTLNESVEYLRKVFAGELEKKQIDIQYDAERNKDFKVLVEPVSFKNQVLGNIISNAIKFSRPGGMIRITCYPVSAHYQAIEIRDFGIGMPEQMIDQMFDLTKKTSRQGTSGELGTGFGMHIMKSFIEMFQGQVLIESTEGGEDSGTTFKLILRGSWK